MYGIVLHYAKDIFYGRVNYLIFIYLINRYLILLLVRQYKHDSFLTH